MASSVKKSPQIWFFNDEDRKLYKRTEVQSYQRFNPFILSGYRGELSLLSCIKSVFLFHNETFNIWTHLLGTCVFLGLLARDLLLIRLINNVSLGDLVVLVSMLLCYTACMLLSGGNFMAATMR